jgi:hypothetical protein
MGTDSQFFRKKLIWQLFQEGKISGALRDLLLRCNIQVLDGARVRIVYDAAHGLYGPWVRVEAKLIWDHYKGKDNIQADLSALKYGLRGFLWVVDLFREAGFDVTAEILMETGEAKDRSPKERPAKRWNVSDILSVLSALSEQSKKGRKQSVPKWKVQKELYGVGVLSGKTRARLVAEFLAAEFVDRESVTVSLNSDADRMFHRPQSIEGFALNVVVGGTQSKAPDFDSCSHLPGGVGPDTHLLVVGYVNPDAKTFSAVNAKDARCSIVTGCFPRLTEALTKAGVETKCIAWPLKHCDSPQQKFLWLVGKFADSLPQANDYVGQVSIVRQDVATKNLGPAEAAKWWDDCFKERFQAEDNDLTLKKIFDHVQVYGKGKVFDLQRRKGPNWTTFSTELREVVFRAGAAAIHLCCESNEAIALWRGACGATKTLEPVFPKLISKAVAAVTTRTRANAAKKEAEEFVKSFREQLEAESVENWKKEEERLKNSKKRQMKEDQTWEVPTRVAKPKATIGKWETRKGA